MKDFVAIDFETANNCRSSVCSVGIVIVRNGIIIDKFYRLIKPVPNYYNRINSLIHGLTKSDTDEAMSFPDVWAEISSTLSDLPFIAHNSSFDESCLKAVFNHYDMQYPNYKFYCTCRASRSKLGKILPNHQLHTVASFFGYNLENHHHALADAEACAIIALNLFDKKLLVSD